MPTCDDEKKDNNQWYFISYTYTKLFFGLGYGCVTMPLDFKLHMDVEKASKEISKITGCKKAVIMYYREISP